ncbi:hypothetical protein OEIGOIKO_05795 [Streptomyces chrestomyceticus JCM 4735]|uniref:Uncharacterized protein n=1 Tax=Streptomyces chrestomyceticus JCM 4735 TaxID=1306181 RepID=A0A7U9Q0L4_9ACTN|nr:hypothetical protein [Streptomyces chrestomyceticus]GCD37985.1 hypothetical protein OEIGOIKO_05795 [Streptomyces chrestomyceticus JCM 4735]
MVRRAVAAASAQGVDRAEVAYLVERFMDSRARYGEQHAHLVWGRSLLDELGLSDGDRAYLYGTTGRGFMTALVEGIAATYDAPAAALAEAARAAGDPAGIAVAYVVASLSLARAVTS